MRTPLLSTRQSSRWMGVRLLFVPSGTGVDRAEGMTRRVRDFFSAAWYTLPQIIKRVAENIRVKGRGQYKMRSRVFSWILANLVLNILVESMFMLAGVLLIDKLLNYLTSELGIESFLISMLGTINKVVILIVFFTAMIKNLLSFTASLRRKEVEALRESHKPFFERVDKEISRRIAASKA